MCKNCGNISNTHSTIDLTFRVHGSTITPYLNGTPLETLDLSDLVKYAETDTRLRLDAEGRRLVYSGEDATNGASTDDSITVDSLLSLGRLITLGDVSDNAPSAHDIFIYDAVAGQWQPYTIPTGTVVSYLGLDEDGKPVKSDSNSGGSIIGVPIGMQMVWSGQPTTVPEGFLICDGREVQRSVYPELFEIIGETYGPGNGSSTFNIPDARDRTVVGVGTDANFDAIGKKSGQSTINLSHSHIVNNHDHFDGVVNTGTTSTNHSHGGISRGGAFSDGQTPDHAHAYARSTGWRAPGTSNSLGDTSVVQKSLAQLWVIRAI